jgi:hypothetical protein
MEQKQIIKTKKELLEVIASYDWNYYNPATQLFLVGDCYYDGSFNSSSVNEFEVDGKALNFLIKRDEEFVLKKQIIKTIEEVDDLTYLYDTYYFDLDSKTFRVADFVEDSEGKCYPDHWLEFSVEGEALEFFLKGRGTRLCQSKSIVVGDDDRDAEDEKRLAEINRLEAEAEEEDVAEEYFTEADAAERAEYDALIESIPCGGVFKGDFGSSTKAQVKAANREWRRRTSTGRFADDGSRWN